MVDAVIDCPECKGTGTVSRKAWTQGPSMEHQGIHPAILAGRSAYKTIVQVACPRGCKKKEEQDEPSARVPGRT